MDTMHIRPSGEMETPWELSFKGYPMAEFIAVMSGEQLQFSTMNEAVMTAMKLQRLSPSTAVMVDTVEDFTLPPAAAVIEEDDFVYLLEPS